MLAYGDDRTFADWLGSLPGDADALCRATVSRSTAEPEEISMGHGAGYFALVWSAGKGLSYNVLGGTSTARRPDPRRRCRRGSSSERT